MTPRERIEATFAGRDTDRIPVHHLGLSSGIASELLGREAYVGGGIQRWREVRALWEGADAHAEFLARSYRDAIDISLLLGNDIVRPSYWRLNRRPSRKIDDNTFLFGSGPEESWTVLQFDPPSEQAAVHPYRPRPELRLENLEDVVERAERGLARGGEAEVSDAFALRAMGEYGAEYAIRVGGVGLGVPHDQAWLEALAVRPDLVGRYLDVQVEQARRSVPAHVAAGFRFLFGGYDFAANTGPMFSPALFRRLLTPRLRAISDLCASCGACHLFASDGCLWPVAPALFVDAGIHGYYEIDASAGMDLEALRRAYPDLTLIGNIRSQTVHLGTRQQVIDETMACLDVARRFGRVIVGTSNYFVPGTPVGNVEALIETIREHR